MPKLNPSDFQAILNQALTGLKGIGTETINTLTAKYAPRIAAVGLHGESATDERNDILENLAIDLADAGIESETIAATAILTAFSVAVDLAAKVAIASLA